MKTIVVVLLLLVAGVVAFGFYQGWFSLSTDNANQKGSITFTVDQEKIRQDRDRLLGQKGKEQTGDQTTK